MMKDGCNTSTPNKILGNSNKCRGTKAFKWVKWNRAKVIDEW